MYFLSSVDDVLFVLKIYKFITSTHRVVISNLGNLTIISSQFDNLLSNDLKFTYKSQTSTIPVAYPGIRRGGGGG